MSNSNLLFKNHSSSEWWSHKISTLFLLISLGGLLVYGLSLPWDLKTNLLFSSTSLVELTILFFHAYFYLFVILIAVTFWHLKMGLSAIILDYVNNSPAQLFCLASVNLIIVKLFFDLF